MLDNCINFGLREEAMSKLPQLKTTVTEFGKNAYDTASRFGTKIHDTASNIGRDIHDTASNVGKSVHDTASNLGTGIHTTANSMGKSILDKASNIDKVKDYLDKNESGRDALATGVGYGALAGTALGTVGTAIAAEQLAQGALHGTGLARRLAISKAAKQNAIRSYDKSLDKLLAKKSEYTTDGKKVTGIDKKIAKLTRVRDNIADKLNEKVYNDESALEAKLAIARSRGDSVTVARITRKLKDLQSKYK